MALRLGWVVIDAHDPDKLAKFWCETLDYEVKERDEDDGEVELSLGPKSEAGALLLLIGGNHDDKKVKNRLHFDLRPDDQDAEVERVLALGATKVDIGQGESTWVVLADPEGNEFCILRDRAAREAESDS
jgi:predicted enzyme related to lactoylglutathione lyase